MTIFDGPVQLSHIFKPKIWGRRDLSPLFALPRGKEIVGADGVRPSPADAGAARPYMPPTEKGTGDSISGPWSPISRGTESGPKSDLQARGQRIGEVWITDDSARFLNGPTAGMTLAEASARYGPELHGKSWPGRRFPLLAKYVFTSDWLSVQVHPDDAYAAVHEPGHVGKCEMWYILKSDPAAGILLGLKPGVTKPQLPQVFKDGTARDFLQSFRPQPEEAVFVPPGMVHALGPGLLLFEVEENSDLTYRLDDFGRRGLDGQPRPLHLEKGLDVIRPEIPPLRDLPRVQCKEKYGARRFVLASRFFALEELLIRHPARFSSAADRVEILSFVEGEGRVENAAGWLAYRTGATWLVPPATSDYRLVPALDTRLFKFYVPDIERDFRAPLKRRGIRPEKIDRIVFE